MFMSIDTGTISKEEKRTGFIRNGRLNPGNRFSNRSKLKSTNTSRSQERCENHVISRGYTNDVIDFRIQPFHESTSSPTGAENHHAWLLVWLRGSQTRVTNRTGRTGFRGGSGEAREESGRLEEVCFCGLFRGGEVTFGEVS